MKAIRLFSLTFVVLMTISRLDAQNITPSMIQKARNAGISQSQIDAAIGNVNNAQRSSGSSRIEAQQEFEEQTITDDIDVSKLGNQNSVPVLTSTPVATAYTPSQIFGKDLFQQKSLTFTPNFKQATPRNYILGAEDELLIEVWGSAEMYTKAKVSPEGTINIRSVGPISVMGLSIDEAEKKIKSKVSTVIGSLGSSSQLKISLTNVRSIKINVVGEVVKPGTYNVSSFASVFNALYAAGGVNEVGSMRNIKVFRNNVQMSSLDVYEFLLQGKAESNIRLQDDDVIIVPAYECYVTISGNVKRPRVFEMKKDESFAQLLNFAGGFKGSAYTKQIEVVRRFAKKQILSVTESEFDQIKVADADSVFVGTVTNFFVNKLSIAGAIWRPGTYQLNEQTKMLSGLIASAEGLRGNEYGVRGLITRTRKDFTKELVSFDVPTVLNKTKDYELQTNDSVYIPTKQEMIEPYSLEILGEVNRPGVYPFEENLNIEDLIIRAQGLTSAASLIKVEVSRRLKDPKSNKSTSIEAQLFEFQIKSDLSLDVDMQKFFLEPYDKVIVRRSPAYKTQKTIFIEGEVLYPGPYQILKTGERISELINRSGGFTKQAYLQGVSLKREMTPAQKLQAQAKRKLADVAVNKKDSAINAALFSVEDMYSVGIDIGKALKHPGSHDDVVLKTGDILFVPKLDNTVKISGAVLQSNSVVFTGGGIKKYIAQAGGYTDFSHKRPYVIYMNGQIAATKGWLFKFYPKVEPGCEIIVPIRTDQEDKLSTAEKLSLLLTASSTATVLLSLLRLF